MNETAKTIKDLTADDVYSACLFVLKQIDAKRMEAFPQTLPVKQMAQKVSVTQDLANAIKNLGYKGDVTYNQFLYPNPPQVRRLLMWLIDTMPKKTVEASTGTASGNWITHFLFLKK